MTLSAEQLLAAANGEDVRFLLDGIEYVVVRSQIYDEAKALVEADHATLRMMLARSSQQSGWDEPGMEAYDSYSLIPLPARR